MGWGSRVLQLPGHHRDGAEPSAPAHTPGCPGTHTWLPWHRLVVGSQPPSRAWLRPWSCQWPGHAPGVSCWVPRAGSGLAATIIRSP